MLLRVPRCTRRRFWCTLLREFHATRPYLRNTPDIFKLDIYTAEAETRAGIDSSPWLSKSPPENGDRTQKAKVFRRGKRKKESFVTSLLLLRDKSACAIEGDEGTGSRFAGKQPALDGKLSSPSTSTKRKAHPGASRNAGGLPYPSRTVFFSSTSQFPTTIERRRPIYTAHYSTHLAQVA